MDLDSDDIWTMKRDPCNASVLDRSRDPCNASVLDRSRDPCNASVLDRSIDTLVLYFALCEPKFIKLSTHIQESLQFAVYRFPLHYILLFFFRRYLRSSCEVARNFAQILMFWGHLPAYQKSAKVFQITIWVIYNVF